MVASREIPKDHAILMCEICRSHIGIFRPEDLESPIDASMFKSIDEFHKFPPPFPAATDGRGLPLTWEFAKCPYCRTRPFMEPDRVKTPYGFVKVGDTAVPRPRTTENDNQEKITEEWKKGQDAELSVEERNQKSIEENFDPPPWIKSPKDDEADFKDPEHIENHVIKDEDVKEIKNVGPQSDRTGDFKADKSILKTRCKFCAKPYNHPSSKSRHEQGCKDNPKNQKKKKKGKK